MRLYNFKFKKEVKNVTLRDFESVCSVIKNFPIIQINCQLGMYSHPSIHPEISNKVTILFTPPEKYNFFSNQEIPNEREEYKRMKKNEES